MCLELDMLVLMVGNPGRIEEGHVGSLIIFSPKRLCRLLVWEVGEKKELEEVVMLVEVERSCLAAVIKARRSVSATRSRNNVPV